MLAPRLSRDAVDTRIVQEVASYGTLGGVILRETDLFPGYGTDPVYLNPRARLTDADNDGMADNWETAHGLSASDATDWKVLNAAGYTRLEEYVNELGAEGVTIPSAGGNWASTSTWGGSPPTHADDVVVIGNLSVDSSNAFARRLTLGGQSGRHCQHARRVRYRGRQRRNYIYQRRHGDLRPTASRLDRPDCLAIAYHRRHAPGRHHRG